MLKDNYITRMTTLFLFNRMQKLSPNSQTPITEQASEHLTDHMAYYQEGSFTHSNNDEVYVDYENNNKKRSFVNNIKLTPKQKQKSYDSNVDTNPSAGRKY